jgi:multidrug efflux pump subunit AcrA (membrane-fusion protein)
VKGRYGLLIPLALAIGLTVTGCGSDSSGETSTPSVSIPAVTSPVPSATSTTVPTTTTAPGTTVTTKGGKTFNPQQPDSPTNDVPPKKGSPQASFEQQCKQNPSACG